MSQRVESKARRYLVEARVVIRLVQGSRVEAGVRGDSGLYRVTHQRGGWRCTCPARSRRCSHVAAVMLIVLPDPNGDYVTNRSEAGSVMTPTDDTLIVSFLRGRFGHTQRSYRTSIDQFRQWFAPRNPGVSILNAERDDIQTWIQTLSRRHLDPGTISVRRSAVRQLFDYLVDEELITVSPAARITVPRSSEPTPKALTNDEVRRLLAASAELSTRHHALVAALAYIGCRVSEICTARIQDLHTGPDGNLWLDLRTKGNKRQRRPVVPALQAALEPVTADRRQGPLLASRRGPGLSPSAAREYVKEVGDRAGIAGVHPHRFRHAAITRLVEDTGDLLMARAVAGHASYDTTARYFAGVDLSEIQRRGAEALATAYQEEPK